MKVLNSWMDDSGWSKWVTGGINLNVIWSNTYLFWSHSFCLSASQLPWSEVWPHLSISAVIFCLALGPMQWTETCETTDIIRQIVIAMKIWLLGDKNYPRVLRIKVIMLCTELTSSLGFILLQPDVILLVTLVLLYLLIFEQFSGRIGLKTLMFNQHLKSM
jgi:hypothetical protein